MSKILTYAIIFFIILGAMGQKKGTHFSLSPHTVIGLSYAQTHLLDGKGTIVAVVDEGFDASHKALKLSAYRYNTRNNSGDISESVFFKDGKYSFESHGTHVAGIILGLAPQTEIIPIKVLGIGGDQAFVKALNIAASSPAHIVNISMRLSYTHKKLNPNIRDALLHLAKEGKLIVIAAGNEGLSLMENAYTKSLVELAHNPLMEGRLLLAGASSYKNGTETLAKFSNFPGNNSLQFAQSYFITAPGEQITSTVTGGGIGEKSGTSMAAPMIVGAASLLKQAFPHFKAEEITRLLLTSARSISLEGTDLPDAYFGAGIVNLRAALEQGSST
ncbi:MAG: S8 family serine peptidase [Alphaproteobacteria bacterium]|jgi:subtilisin family serine protease|nr:S8 family serine peptidase [Alphaproteobacteria bacterium]MBP7729073.1 S8 family serine peptidase [Alphaproteobacteria bacterium]